MNFFNPLSPQQCQPFYLELNNFLLTLGILACNELYSRRNKWACVWMQIWRMNNFIRFLLLFFIVDMKIFDLWKALQVFLYLLLIFQQNDHVPLSRYPLTIMQIIHVSLLKHFLAKQYFSFWKWQKMYNKRFIVHACNIPVFMHRKSMVFFKKTEWSMVYFHSHLQY